MNNLTKYLIIHGRVQGVGFRAWTCSNARKHGINGWVRNRADGTVEAVMSGEAAQIEEMIKLCHKGPMAAHVTKVDVEESNEDVPAGFSQRDTERLISVTR